MEDLTGFQWSSDVIIKAIFVNIVVRQALLVVVDGMPFLSIFGGCVKKE